MYIFDLELYSFLIIVILIIDYYSKYKKSFEVDSYIGIAYIISVIIFLIINIGIYTAHSHNTFGNLIISFSYIYSFIPPSILYIYTKRNYSEKVINIKKEIKKILIYDFLCIILTIFYLNSNIYNISLAVSKNLSFFPHDYILSLTLLPLLFFSFRILINVYKKKEEIIYKLYAVTFIISLFVVLNFYTSFIMLGTVIYTVCALLICLNKYDKSIYRDSLTGLYNKRKLEQYIRSNTNTHNLRALYVIDMDKFKDINDNYGHSKGDSVLRSAASIIKKSISVTDFAVRYGGDEFIIVAEINNEKDMDLIPKKINKNISYYNKKTDIPISLSIGGSIWNKNENFKDIMEKSDCRMYKNKHDKVLTINKKSD